MKNPLDYRTPLPNPVNEKEKTKYDKKVKIALSKLSTLPESPNLEISEE